MLRGCSFIWDPRKALEGELGAAGLRAEKKEQQVWGCGGAGKGEHRTGRGGGMALDGGHKGVSLVGDS